MDADMRLYDPSERPEFPRHVPADTNEEFRFRRVANSLWGQKKDG